MSAHLAKVPNFYDYLKHLTTLATGSIVLLATFAEKFPAASSWRLLLRVAMAAFLLSVLFTFILSAVALFAGVLFIALFSIRNV
jgi:hypothetical protein